MKHIFFRVTRYALYVAVSATVLAACKGKDGDPGPQGDTGPVGAQGTPGPQGNNSSEFIKDGTVTGSIAGKRSDGVTPIQETFKYEYRSSRDFFYNNGSKKGAVTETETPGIYRFEFELTDSINHYTSFHLVFNAPLNLSNPEVQSATLEFSRDLDSKQVLTLTAEYYYYSVPPTPLFTFNSLKYNPTTGLLTGNYTWNAIHSDGLYSSYTNTKQTLTISGSFNVSLRQTSSFRIGR